jgi:hypothetical protein
MIDEATYYGGSLKKTLAAEYHISPRRERFGHFDATGSNFAVRLPDATQLRTGLDTMLVAAFTNTLTVKDKTGATLTTIGVDRVKRFHLLDNSTAAGVWHFSAGLAVSLGTAV